MGVNTFLNTGDRLLFAIFESGLKNSRQMDIILKNKIKQKKVVLLDEQPHFIL